MLWSIFLVLVSLIKLIAKVSALIYIIYIYTHLEAFRKISISMNTVQCI